MESRRPQLTLDELHQLKWLLGGALALFSVWTVFYLDIDTWSLLIQSTVAVAAALVWPRLPSRIPRWVHFAAFPAIAVFFAVDLWLTSQLLPAMIRLDLMLILYRGISYRERREDLQLIVLGLFLVVVAGVLTVSLAFAAQILAFSACALALLLVITLVDAAEAVHPPVKKPLFTWGLIAPVPAWTRQGSWPRLFSRLRAVADWRVVALGLGLFSGVVALSALLFLAIPRFQLENTLFLDRFISRKVRSGFTESIRFGEVTDIMSDKGLAVSVDITDPRDLPATLYLRMLVLDYYSNGGFQMSRGLRNASFGREQNVRYIPGSAPRQAGEPVYWTFYFEPGVSRYLPMPGQFAGLGFNELQNVSWSDELMLAALRNEPASMVAYRLERPIATAKLPDSLYAARLKEASREGAVPLPELRLLLTGGEPDQAALRQELSEALGGLSAAEAGDLSPEDFAGRICKWLVEKHTYSMQSAMPAGAGDPLVRWIGSGTPGHCELFAGAFVILARAAGFPARVVCGFKGGTWNAFTGNLTVRNSDAHAWCEIWDGNGAWLRVDPTPGATAVATADEPRGEASFAKRVDSSWSARLDSLRILWYRRVVSFDQNTQINTVRRATQAVQDAGRRARAALESLAQKLKDWFASPWSGRRIGGVAGSVLAIAVAGWLLRAVVRRWRWGPARSARLADPVRAEAGRWLRKLVAQEGDTGVMAELRRLRYGSSASWPKPNLTFARARRAWRDRKSTLKYRPSARRDSGKG